MIRMSKSKFCLFVIIIMFIVSHFKNFIIESFFLQKDYTFIFYNENKQLLKKELINNRLNKQQQSFVKLYSLIFNCGIFIPILIPIIKFLP